MVHIQKLNHRIYYIQEKMLISDWDFTQLHCMNSLIYRYASEHKKRWTTVYCMREVRQYECKSCVITKEICTYYRKFCTKKNISIEESLDFFYHSFTYELMSKGISDMHCMSDEYLIEDLEREYSGEYGNR